jgi:hypothetical protein
MSKSWLFVGLAVLLAGESGAQPAPPEEERRQPTHEIRVLRHPYDISSFYTSSPTPAPAFRGGAFAAPEARDCSEERYPISCYYRSAQRRPWIGHAKIGDTIPIPHDRLPNRVMSPLFPILLTPWGH